MVFWGKPDVDTSIFPEHGFGILLTLGFSRRKMLRNARFRPILREGTVVRAHAIVREYDIQY